MLPALFHTGLAARLDLEDQNFPAGMQPGSPDYTPILFERFANLAARLPRIPLVQSPTPVHRLDRISDRLGHEVWIKRDDLTSPEYGGNKPRKLEFLLAAARALGRDTLVTGGGIGSNHALATAYFGRRLGFQVILDLCPQPVTDHVRRNLKLYHALGARLSLAGGQRSWAVRQVAAGCLCRRKAYFIPPGASNTLGTIGYVVAGLEIARQVQDGALPPPEAVFTAVGSAGTMAGMVLGLKLGGLATKVIGVQVATRLTANSWVVAHLAARTLKRLRHLDPSVPKAHLTPSEMTIVRDQYGPGYGHPTPAGRRAVEIMAGEEGLRLDLTYTAKVFAAVQDHIRSGRVAGPVLFLHTYSARELTSLMEPVHYLDLPPAFHQFFG